MSDDGNTEEKFISRFGDQFGIDDFGYANIPGWVIRNTRFLLDNNNEIVGISDAEFRFFVNIMSHKYDSKHGVAKPGMDRISRRMEKSRESVRRAKKELVDKGLLKIIPQANRSKTDIYDFSELIIQCKHWELFWSINNIDVDLYDNPIDDIDHENEGTQICGGHNFVEGRVHKFVYRRIITKETESKLLSKDNNEEVIDEIEDEDETNRFTPKPVNPGTKNAGSNKLKIKRKSKRRRRDSKVDGVAVYSEWIYAVLKPWNLEGWFDGSNYNDPQLGRYIRAASTMRKAAIKAVEELDNKYVFNTHPDELVKALVKWLEQDKELTNYSVQAFERYFPEFLTAKDNKQSRKNITEADDERAQKLAEYLKNRKT